MENSSNQHGIAGLERKWEKWDGILRDSSCRGKSSPREDLKEKLRDKNMSKREVLRESQVLRINDQINKIPHKMVEIVQAVSLSTTAQLIREQSFHSRPGR